MKRILLIYLLFMTVMLIAGCGRNESTVSTQRHEYAIHVCTGHGGYESATYGDYTTRTFKDGGGYDLRDPEHEGHLHLLAITCGDGLVITGGFPERILEADDGRGEN